MTCWAMLKYNFGYIKSNILLTMLHDIMPLLHSAHGSSREILCATCATY